MAYAICDQLGIPRPIRLLMVKNENIEIGEPFTPHWWVCDPCNPAASRYEVMHRANQEKPTGYPWYQVITWDDTDADVECKVNHYRAILRAHRAL